MSGERGSALLVALFVLLVCGLALTLAALQIQWAASRYLFERERLVADRLSEAGVTHASARLGQEPGFRGTLEGRLAGGRYQVEVSDDGGGGLVVASTGTASSRSVRLVLALAPAGGRLEVKSRERTHLAR